MFDAFSFTDDDYTSDQPIVICTPQQMFSTDDLEKIKNILYDWRLSRIDDYNLKELLLEQNLWLVRSEFGNRVSAREYFRYCLDAGELQGFRTKTGDLEELVVNCLALYHGWIVITANLDKRGTSSDSIFIKGPRILVCNIKSSKKYGNGADDTPIKIVEFIKNGNYTLPNDNRLKNYSSQFLSELKEVEVLIGGRTTESDRQEIVNGIKVNFKFGTALFTFLDIAENYNIGSIMKKIEFSNGRSSFSSQRKAIIDKKTEDLYEQLILKDNGIFQGRKIIVKHDIIDLSELEGARNYDKC